MSGGGGGRSRVDPAADAARGKWRRRATRYGPPILFPIISAITASVAGVNHGSVRVYWTLAAVAATAGTSIFNGLKERQAALSTSAAEAAVEARTELGKAFARAAEPLITALGEVATALNPGDRKAKIDVLTRLTVDVAAARCGRDVADRGAIRSVFYELSNAKDVLSRSYYAGRQGNKKPRQFFEKNSSSHDNLAFNVAEGDEVLLVTDLENHPPPEFYEAKSRSYRSFITVAVAAGAQHYGLLSVDSDKANSLTDVDRGYLVLLAGILGAGLAYQDQIDRVRGPAAIPDQPTKNATDSSPVEKKKAGS